MSSTLHTDDLMMDSPLINILYMCLDWLSGLSGTINGCEIFHRLIKYCWPVLEVFIFLLIFMV